MPTETYPYASWAYKKERPADRALVVAGTEKGEMRVLDHIGPALDHWLHEMGGEFPAPDGPGFWIWEGGISSWIIDTDYGREADCELEGEYRRLTDEERESLFGAGDVVPWDYKLWVDNLDEAEPMSEEEILLDAKQSYEALFGAKKGASSTEGSQ